MKQRAESLDYLQREVGPLSDSIAQALCDALEDLPEALRMATVVIQLRKISAQEYLDLFLQEQTKLLSHGNPPADYPILITASLCSQHVPAEDLIIALIASMAAPRDIPFSLLGDWKVSGLVPANMPQHRAKIAEILQGMPASFTNAESFHRTLARLSYLGLIEVSEDAFSFVHPLVQSVYRRILPKQQLKVFVELLLVRLSILEERDPEDDVDWSKIKRLAPHLEALVSFLESMQIYKKHAGELLFAASGYFLLKKEPKKARELSLRALPHLKADGPVSKVFREAYEIQGSVLYSRGVGGAKELFEAALEVSAQPFTAHNANVLYHLGELLSAEGDSKAARARWQEALLLAEQDLSVNPGVAFSCAAALGRVLQLSGDDEEAELLLSRALQFPRGKGQLGVEIMALTVLAHAQLSLEKYPAAMDTLRRVSDLLEPHGEEAAPMLGLILGDIAEVHYHTDAMEDAKQTVMRAISMIEGSRFEQSPSFTKILVSAGRILRKHGDKDGSRSMLNRALARNNAGWQEEIQEELAKLD